MVEDVDLFEKKDEEEKICGGRGVVYVFVAG